jgi:hypothetical protein
MPAKKQPKRKPIAKRSIALTSTYRHVQAMCDLLASQLRVAGEAETHYGETVCKRLETITDEYCEENERADTLRELMNESAAELRRIADDLELEQF